MKKINIIKRKLFAFQRLISSLSSMGSSLQKIQESLGRIESRQLQSLNIDDIQESEFRVFSQWGEDGILQFLTKSIAIKNRIFVEFGVENYTESNTRFLLTNYNWSGLIIDGNKKCIDFIKKDPIYWRFNIKAIHSFITKENINSLIKENGIEGDIGLLSVDIDGNDYWVWEAINVIQPAIVVVEYNSRYGIEDSVTIPYKADFTRSTAHYSNIYYGASLKAFYLLGKRKGYSFVGCNTAGNNAFFIRKDLKPDHIKELTVDEGYVAAKFRELRNKEGKLSFLSFEEEAEILNSLPIVKIDESEN